MQENFAHENSSSDDSCADSFSDCSTSDQSEQLNQGNANKTEIALSMKQHELDQSETARGMSTIKSSSEHASSHLANTSAPIDDIDEIGREFYEYINSEFATPKAPTDHRVIEQRYAVNENDCNNNPVAATLDDDDFW